MPRPKPACESLFTWLRLNLGRQALAPLTGTDWKALSAVAHIVELYAYTRSDAAVRAFGDVVRCMQPSTRELAYHAPAFAMEWGDRAHMWQRAGLDPIPVRRMRGERAEP